MKTLALVIGTVMLIVVSATWHGYVLSVIWDWFVTPTFNAPRLSIPVAIGLASTIGFITKPYSDSKDDDGKEFSALAAGLFMKAFGGPAVTLFFCWIVKHWM